MQAISTPKISTDGITVVDKPQGVSSFDVIRAMKRMFGFKKIGHAGTLDPMATGLMIIGIDQGTKKLTEYLKLPKSYRAEILFGVKTDSSDLDGQILEKKSLSDQELNVLRDSESLSKVLNEMIGTLSLPVSAFSALKKDGVPLYKRARAGEVVENPIRDMVISDAQLIHAFSGDGDPCIVVEFSVSSGTYIRSLAVELGRRLGMPATLKNLRRLTIGDFKVSDAFIFPEGSVRSSIRKQ